MKKHSTLVFTLIITFCMQGYGQTGFTENFETDPGWTGTGQYHPSHQDSVEYIRVTKHDYWAGFGELLGDTIDISSNKFVNLKVHVQPPAILYVYLFDTNNNHTGPVGIRIPEGENYIDLCWDFNGRFATTDSTAISEILFAVNGMAEDYTGDVWFDDLKIGTDAIQMANLGRVDGQVHFKNSGSQSVLITDIENADSITASGAGTLMQNIDVAAIADGTATLTYDLVPDATGTGKVTLTAHGTGAWQNNTYL